MRSRFPVRLRLAALATALLALGPATGLTAQAAEPTIAVGTQYDTTHVYVTPGAMDAFVTSWEAVFGGHHTQKALVTVTPTPSRTYSELVLSPVGTLSVFDYQTPAPYPFGAERTGWLVKDLDRGVRKAEQAGAAVVVAPFDDPIGRDAVVQFPGGIDAQLYWHTTPPSYPALATVPENRLYVPAGSLHAFLRSYLRFTGGRVVSDDSRAPGAELGLPGSTYHRIRITGPFGDTAVLATDGHLPYPFGRELTGYQVDDLTATLARARTAGAQVLWGPQTAGGRDSALVQFPGGYLAELHDLRPGR
ncbi:glyoxalase [Saccharothrix sp. ST-888]|uniref:glyoxalase n=1 Tax=Saccharothrix sp. ST-888 TaxID=1427391 RepID=UPI0005EC7F71|nr:glyoxalase [Saccharothrix sp. ST-888]KJK59114.1 glyoxalase [Saccharothrix sp. ST-888]